MLGRFLAAISYIGLTGALTPLAQPDNTFVVRHARGALVVHLLRFALVGRSSPSPPAGSTYRRTGTK